MNQSIVLQQSQQLNQLYSILLQQAKTDEEKEQLNGTLLQANRAFHKQAFLSLQEIETYDKTLLNHRNNLYMLRRDQLQRLTEKNYSYKRDQQGNELYDYHPTGINRRDQVLYIRFLYNLERGHHYNGEGLYYHKDKDYNYDALKYKRINKETARQILHDMSDTEGKLRFHK